MSQARLAVPELKDLPQDPGVNRTEISAQIIERGPLRKTPAGMPALDLKLIHQGTIMEAGVLRKVFTQVKAKAIGGVAERLDCQEVGSQWCFSGFLASPGKPMVDVSSSRSVVLHILDFQSI